MKAFKIDPKNKTIEEIVINYDIANELRNKIRKEIER